MSKLPSEIANKLQDLSPNLAKLCLKVRGFMNTWFEKDVKSCLVACSGGADSVALALILHYLKIDIELAHFNHELRERAKDDEEFTINFGKLLNVKTHVKRMDIAKFAKENKYSVEEAGRIARYDFFNEICEQQKLDFIATGHHLGDLAEDIILRMLRGSAWTALGGMPAYDEKRKLIRPLLSTPKEELQSFLTALNIDWCEDETNKDLNYKRNRVRNIILPMFEIENPAFTKTAFNLWQQAQIDKEFFEDNLKFIKIETNDKSYFLHKQNIKNMPQALRLRAYNFIFKHFQIQSNFDMILKLDLAFINKNTGAIFDLKNMNIQITKHGINFNSTLK